MKTKSFTCSNFSIILTLVLGINLFADKNEQTLRMGKIFSANMMLQQGKRFQFGDLLLMVLKWKYL